MRYFTPIIFATLAVAAGKPEFEVASIKPNAPQAGFHFAADAASGGPGTGDPGIFRCTKCSLATLVSKAFHLQPYQFPGRATVGDQTYDVMAKVPAGATEEEFALMLQNLLQERFALTWHFQEKTMKGYHLTIAKSGSKLKESGDAPPAVEQHGNYGGGGDSHSHSGAMVFGSTAMYQGQNKTMAELVRVLSDQIGLPVDDQTGLTGKYDISLRWTGNGAPHEGNHADGGFGGHGGGHDFGGGGGSAAGADASGPTIFEALQQQLGLKLAPAEQTTARLFVIDHVSPKPTEN